MNALAIVAFFAGLVATAFAGGLVGYGGLGYGGLGYGGLGYGGLGYGGLGYGGLGVGGVGVGSSVALLHGGPPFAKAVAGPAFLVRSVHHVNKIHGGGALLAHSGLGAGYGGLGYGGLGYGGLGYGGLGYGGLGYGYKG
ncbi:uncharacterized protein LOC144094245 [Amblyomma americanum]|uniref:Uncharacterized protein n=1 Tax=Amblyomma americanum TaxID=6943 RepID=A0AAQ4F276_AMBAM